MESNNQTENEFNLMSFDLGESGGGTQMIFAHKAVNEKEHYVFTLGNGPKDEQATQSAESAKEANGAKGLSKQLLSNFRNQFGLHKNANSQAETEAQNPQNIKLRCFKLSQVEGQKYNVQEYTTPKGVSDVARLFGAGQDDPEMTR